MSLRWAATTPTYAVLHRRESPRNRVTVYYGACLTQGRNPMIKRETKGCPRRRIELRARDYARESFQETSENLRLREITSRVLSSRLRAPSRRVSAFTVMIMIMITSRYDNARNS